MSAFSFGSNPRLFLRVMQASGFMAAALVASGCAHVRTGDDGKDSSSSPKSVSEVISGGLPGGPVTVPKPVMTSAQDMVFHGMKVKNNQFDIPVQMNSRVEYWIDYFTGKGRGHFERYLERSEFFIPYIRPILRQNEMPQDLVYLAMIESGFNNFAKSSAKAVGAWQFMSATGKRYGLMVNWWVDERRDVRKSTLAAVQYLKDLYEMFQSWELAAASYNAGEAKVARAIQRYGTNDFWVLARHRYLRAETRDYVPKMFAAAIIAKNRAQFGFPERYTHPGADEAVAGDGELVKVIKSDNPDAGMVAIGDSIGGKITQVQAQAERGEPAASEDDESDDDASVTPATLTIPLEPTLPEGQIATAGPLAKPVPTPHFTKDGKVGGEELSEFDVKSPADLLKVARAAGLSYQTVKSLNPELLRWCTPPTVTSFRLKLPASSKERFLQAYNHEAFPRQVQFMAYKIRKGETLTHVARHFGIRVDPIADLNGVSPRAPLRNGVTVLLPIPNDRSRSLASLDVKDPPEGRRRGSRRRHKFYKIDYKRREAARTVSSVNNKKRRGT